MGISSSLCIGSHKTQAQTAMSSSSPAGRDTSLVQAHTHNTLHVPKQTHIFVDLPSTSMAPLPTQLRCPAPSPLTHPTGPQSLFGPAWYSLVNLHTHLSRCTPHSEVLLGVLAQTPACLIPHREPEVPLLIGGSTFKFVSEYRCTHPQTNQVWGRYRHSPPSSQYPALRLWPAVMLQPLTPSPLTHS